MGKTTTLWWDLLHFVDQTVPSRSLVAVIFSQTKKTMRRRHLHVHILFLIARLDVQGVKRPTPHDLCHFLVLHTVFSLVGVYLQANIIRCTLFDI